MKIESLQTIVYATMVALLSLSSAAAAQPNIVLILADDIGIEGLGCYGGVSYQTPELDKLAEGGVRFTHAFSTPLCTPTRVQLMTGKYNHRNWKSFGILDPKETTFGHRMQDAGYATAIFGKWQLQSYDPPGYPGAMQRRGTGMHPQDAGFDDYALYHALHTEDKGSRYANPSMLEGKSKTPGTLKSYPGKFGEDIWVDKTIDFLDRHREQPAFVYYPMALPHWPFVPTPISEDWNPELPVTESIEYTRDMVEYMDVAVGNLVRGLEAKGLREDTLVIFYGDNGTHLDVTSELADGRKIPGGKGTPQQTGIHVPLIVSWPGHIQPAVSNSLVDPSDFLPTLMELAGHGLEPADTCDGISFAAELLGQPSKKRESVFCWYDPRPGHDKSQFSRSVFALDHHYKYFRDGRLFRFTDRPLEEMPVDLASATQQDQAAIEKLKRAIEVAMDGVAEPPLVDAFGKPIEARKTSSNETRQPNFVLMIADDMNWDDCGAYGHPAIRTPNIDRLAREGMRFEHAYLTTNSCSPSRASIITGKYPHNTGAEQLHWPIPPGSRTFTKELKSLGYYTAAAGKWHMGDAIRDHFDVVYEASTAGFVLPSGKDGEPAKMIARQPSGCEDWEKALEERDKDKPFLMWLAALDPHREYTAGALDPPHAVEDVIVPPHLPDTPDVREDLRLYYDEIGRLDKYVGKVMDKLDSQGVADNTVVLFISDNGRHFPRHKTTLYDGGIRTPWIVRWPNRIAAGTTSRSLVSAVDIAPTFVGLAGGDVSGFGGEGNSFAPVLRNLAVSVRDFAFAEDHWHDYEDHARCVMDQRYKLIRNDYVDLPPTPSADAGRGLTWQDMLKLNQSGKLTPAQQTCFRSPRPQWELFDLQRDPGELTNRIDDPAYRAVKERLTEAMDQWTLSTGDYIPTQRTPDEFDRVTGEPDHSVRVRPRPSKHDMFGTDGKY